MKTNKLQTLPELEKLSGSSYYCKYGVIELKLEVIYRNQEKIYSLLKELVEEKRNVKLKFYNLKIFMKNKLKSKSKHKDKQSLWKKLVQIGKKEGFNNYFHHHSFN